MFYKKKINSKYILALINSALVNFYFQYLNPETGEALAEVKKETVEAVAVASRTAADGMQLHGAHDKDRGDDARQMIEAEPTLLYVATSRLRGGEEKLRRPDE